MVRLTADESVLDSVADDTNKSAACEEGVCLAGTDHLAAPSVELGIVGLEATLPLR
jgi:hypothetical protein